MSIWNINNIQLTNSEAYIPREVRLWKIDNHNYRVIEQGDYLPILGGPNYTLLKKKYAPIFSSLNDLVTFHSIIIHDTVLKLNNTDYVELLSSKTITPGTIQNEDSSGLKVWTYKGSLFVSDELKTIIEKHTNQEFQFHLGFQTWGG
jgi:hypothetical protein